ncbi:MAG: SRPBCC domain-containing protein [Hyphomicrobiales bacterium]|nr:SRPBCC domain-containing protein [Hyphomicrobiales bacterium]
MAKTTAKTTDIIKVRQAVRADAATVWGCLVEPRAWWNGKVDLDARPGGTFTEPWTDEKGKRHVTRGSVIAFHPPHGLVLAWADEGWRNAPAARRLRLMKDHCAGWKHHLKALANFAERRAAH